MVDGAGSTTYAYQVATTDHSRQQDRGCLNEKAAT